MCGSPGERPRLAFWLRLVIVAAYLAVFGCNSAANAVIYTVKGVTWVVRGVASAADRPRRLRAQRAHDSGGENSVRWPDYDAELIQPDEAGPRDHVPDGHWRTERGAALDAPRPARR
jgi:hypothetical protein